VAGNAGTATPNLASYWEVATAGRTVLLPRGHGRTVVAMTTEGSLAMACGGPETAARFHLPIIFVHFTNDSLGWIKMLRHLYMGERYFGAEPGPIDVPDVARGVGLHATRTAGWQFLGAIIHDKRLTNTCAPIPIPTVNSSATAQTMTTGRAATERSRAG